MGDSAHRTYKLCICRRTKKWTNLSHSSILSGVRKTTISSSFLKCSVHTVRGKRHNCSRPLFTYSLRSSCDVCWLILHHTTSVRLINIEKMFLSFEDDILTSKRCSILRLHVDKEQSLHFRTQTKMWEIWLMHCWNQGLLKLCRSPRTVNFSRRWRGYWTEITYSCFSLALNLIWSVCNVTVTDRRSYSW